MGKDSGLLIALVCDRTFQSITLLQISSSFHHQKRGRVKLILNPQDTSCQFGTPARLAGSRTVRTSQVISQIHDLWSNRRWRNEATETRNRTFAPSKSTPSPSALSRRDAFLERIVLICRAIPE